MRKPRDFDADLKALETRARELRQRKQHQLGELIIATGADALPVEELAGALLAAVETLKASTASPPVTTSGANRQDAARPATGRPDFGSNPDLFPHASGASNAAAHRATREGWRKAGAAFFLGGARPAVQKPDSSDDRPSPGTSGAQPTAGQGGAA